MAVSAAAQGSATIAVSQDQLGSAGARLLAQIIDGVVVGIAAGIAAGGSSMSAAAAMNEESSPFGMVLLVVGGLASLAVVVYQLYLLATQGQTIGKRMMNLRIVKRDTGQNGGVVPNIVMRLIVNAVLSAIPLYQLVDILFIFRSDKRCIHDMLAGTVVVKA